MAKNNSFLHVFGCQTHTCIITYDLLVVRMGYTLVCFEHRY